MLAPIYPPSIAYEMPLSASSTISVDSASFLDILEMPSAWQIARKHFPGLEAFAADPLMRPHAGNFTVRQTVQLSQKDASAAALQALDEALRALSPGRGVAP